MMTRKNRGGYTIIEVLLFLAISSLTILIAFAGFGARLQTVRFSDGMRSLQGFFERETAAVNSGFNPQLSLECRYAAGALSVVNKAPGGAEIGANTDCIVLGSYFELTNNSSEIQISTVVSKRPDLLESRDATSDEQLLTDFQGIDQKILISNHGSLSRRYRTEWGLVFTHGLDSASAAITEFGVIRGPITGSAFVVKQDSSGDIRIADSLPYKLCFKDSNGRKGSAIVGAGEGTDITLKFEDPDC